MSSIADAIQDKCLAFGDRVIKLNDYLLEQASQKYDAGRQKYGMRKGKSALSLQPSFGRKINMRTLGVVSAKYWRSEGRR